MPISWNEIRHNAIRFAHDWAGARSETAEKQTFWNEFFEVFGFRRRLVATFEEPVKKLSGDYGYIDLFWPGTLVVEHKSLGKDLGKAESQAFRYIRDLLNAGRLDEVPRYVIVSDFARIALHDLEPEDQKPLPLLGQVKTIEFGLADFHKNIHTFAFIPGYKQHKFEDQDPINLQAVGILGNLHDTLEAGGYSGHELERSLVRILFCLFAEDTGIFEREAFRLYIENRTKPDGTDLGLHLARLFEVLNTDEPKRQKNLDETLADFPYVNGDLFAEHLGFADFNRDMRNALLACTRFDWSRISPAIFGSLFQAVMEPRQRRQIGGHYTNERDILKVVRGLLLDELREEFQRVKNNKPRLRRFHKKIGSLRFLDPACGCGNFLVITYRELRLLEIEVLQALHGSQLALEIDVQHFSLLDVDAFYGIEISEWPARIAEVAMWLMDHQMNIRLSEVSGQLYQRLPLRKKPSIVNGNALRLDWKKILMPDRCSYILGNPPFVGKKEQNAEQKADMDILFGKVKGAGILDYVSSWYIKAAEYIQGTKIRVAFVSTNSITQGEQVGVLWKELLDRYRVNIHFAHRTFPWESEARGKSHVHVIIIGFGMIPLEYKLLFDYDESGGDPHVMQVSHINPYLVEGPSVLILNRSKPISDSPKINYGSFALDDGNYTLSPEDRDELLRECPDAKKYLRRFIGGQELLHAEDRYCLWLKGANPTDLKNMPAVLRRVEAVRKWRLSRGRQTTKELSATPTLFAEIRQPDSSYLALPTVSSEKRRYIPIAYLTPDIIASNQIYVIAGAKTWHFGVLHSAMHMAWVHQVCGRLKSDYRYSTRLVYNNYPWPDSPSAKHRSVVEKAAQGVLDARAEFLPPKGDATLADLYDPLAMPPRLVKAHAVLDRAVDLCYRPQPFTSERHRVEFLFALYEKLTAPLIPAAKKRKRRK